MMKHDEKNDIAMANGNRNLMDEFEEAFQHCLHVLTKQDPQSTDDDVIKLEVEQTTMNFVNLARQIDVFFLQNRFRLSALKPELLLNEENYDLKYELQRKDELIKKHYEKIEQWKKLLNNDQPAKPPAAAAPMGAAGPSVGGMNPVAQMNPNPGPGIQNPMHMQQQMQMQQQIQAANHHHQQQRMMMNPNMFPGGGVGPLSYLEKSADLLGMGGGDNCRR